MWWLCDSVRQDRSLAAVPRRQTVWTPAVTELEFDRCAAAVLSYQVSWHAWLQCLIICFELAEMWWFDAGAWWPRDLVLYFGEVWIMKVCLGKREVQFIGLWSMLETFSRYFQFVCHKEISERCGLNSCILTSPSFPFSGGVGDLSVAAWAFWVSEAGSFYRGSETRTGVGWGVIIANCVGCCIGLSSFVFCTLWWTIWRNLLACQEHCFLVSAVPNRWPQR